MNLFKYTNSNKRYNTLDYFYKEKFNEKIFKVSLNGGFTCPNKDGSKGSGGCIYCSVSGSGDFAGKKDDPLTEQFNQVKESMHKKWPKAKYIGYFQANTNTYAEVSVLREKYEEILNLPNVVGLAIGTRSDAITDDVLAYLDELNKKTFLTVELGLQTANEETSNFINRGHTLANFEDMVYKLSALNINTVVHIINGLPYETKEMMIDTVKYLNKLPINGIKIHMLHILEKTKLAKIYLKNPFHILSKEEYIDIVCDQLELLRPDIVINRITGDPNEDDLVEPKWITKKFGVLNDIDKELKKRDTYQGFNLDLLNKFKQIINTFVKENDLVIEVDPENCNNLLFISKYLKSGHLFILNESKQLLNMAQIELKKNYFSNYTLLDFSYSEISKLTESCESKISLIVFNIKNKPKREIDITLINSYLRLLNNKGMIIFNTHDENSHNQILNELKISNLPSESHLAKNGTFDSNYIILDKKKIDQR